MGKTFKWRVESYESDALQPVIKSIIIVLLVARNKEHVSSY